MDDRRRLRWALSRQKYLVLFHPWEWLDTVTARETETLDRARATHGGQLVDASGTPYADVLIALEAWVAAAARADDWRQQLGEFLSALRPHPGAEKVFTTLVDAGACPYEMADDLQRWMAAERGTESGPRGLAARRAGALSPGRVFHLAEQLKAAAARLEQLRDAAQTLAIWGFHTDLPERLRAEATILGQLAPLADRRRLNRTAIISSLQDHLEETTGRACDAQLADLLEVTRRRGRHRPVSARSLEQLRRRRRRCPTALTPELSALIRHRTSPVSLRSLIRQRRGGS